MAQDRDQDHTGCKQPEAPPLCVNNCGFFGCPATMNLCSKCYELRVEEESQVAVKAFGEKNPIMLSALVEKSLSKGALSACTPTTDGSQGGDKAFGEKNPIMLSARVEKSLSKGALSACTPTTDSPQGDLVSVSSIQASTEPLASKGVEPSASGVDVFKPAEPIEVTTVTHSIPVVQAQSSGSTRCLSCRKRVGLLGFKCRCGGVFCAGHRYSDKHGCSFDYKAAGRDAIAKANPVVKAEKVERI